jgi:acyl carrier protein
MSTIDDAPVREKIRAFILSSVQIPDLADDDNLFETGIINSLFAVELMTFLEKTFGIEVGPDDLEITNFQSVSASAEFVLRKRERAAAV